MMHRKLRYLLLASCLLCLALPALAAGGEGEGGLFSGDLGNVIWTLISFGLVLFVLGKFAWGPILENLQKREDFIHDSLEKARKDRDEAEQRLQDYVAKVEGARAEATAIVEEGRRDAEVVRQRIEEEARAEADKMIARARREIDIARATAVKELHSESGRLAVDIASRIVGRELSADDHERLIRDSLGELGQAETH